MTPMFLRPEFPNGQFGDPALYIWESEPKGPEGSKSALLIDCGDLTRFSPKQLLRVKSLLLSHCHMDHFFGFDLLLKYLIGTQKTLNIYGPPKISERVSGKLQAYTWNLIQDQSLQFSVIELDVANSKKRITQFHARDGFLPSSPHLVEWNPVEPVLDSEDYLVRSAVLDHRTPSMAYAIEEKQIVAVNQVALQQLGYRPGVWIKTLKYWYLVQRHSDQEDRDQNFILEVPLVKGGVENRRAIELSSEILVHLPRHKIVYATDGAAHSSNREALMPLLLNADLFFCETCFLQKDLILADKTKHFTAQFIAKLSQEAGVKKLAPFHFSKRYIGRPQDILKEISEHYYGEIIGL